MSKKPESDKIQFLKLAKVEKINFAEGNLKEGAEKIVKENNKLIESTQVDSQNLKLRFEI